MGYKSTRLDQSPILSFVLAGVVDGVRSKPAFYCVPQHLLNSSKHCGSSIATCSTRWRFAYRACRRHVHPLPDSHLLDGDYAIYVHWQPCASRDTHALLMTMTPLPSPSSMNLVLGTVQDIPLAQEPIFISNLGSTSKSSAKDTAVDVL